MNSGTDSHAGDDHNGHGDGDGGMQDGPAPGEAFEEMLEPKLHHRRRRELADGFKKNKVVNEVLDKRTVMTLYKMITDGILSGVNGSVSAGKESLVFWGLGPTGADVALKIYLVSTSNFKRRQAYMEGDPRFASVRGGTRNMVYLWARKEFRNLTQCVEAGIPVPRPIHVANNVLAMEFIDAGHASDSGIGGDGSSSSSSTRGRPAAQLLHWPVDDSDYRGALSILRDMYAKANLVHGDYSEYNIFKVRGRGLVVFDLGAAVDRRHPNARMFLQRDINNITRFFEKKGVSVDDPGRIMEEMTSSS